MCTQRHTFKHSHARTCIFLCCYVRWCNDYALRHVHPDTHHQICTHAHTHTHSATSTHTLFSFLFEYSFFPPSPPVPKGPSTSVHRHISFWSVVSMEPPVSCDLSAPPFRESRASGHSESLPQSAFVRKKIQQRKGTGRIKGDESTDISWRLLLSKWRIVLFVLTHLITPPPLHISVQAHDSTPPHPPPALFCTHMLPPSLCSSHPVFMSQIQISVCFIPINNRGVFDWVQINNSQPISGGLTCIPPATDSQWEMSFGDSNEIRGELVLWCHWKEKWIIQVTLFCCKFPLN